MILSRCYYKSSYFPHFFCLLSVTSFKPVLCFFAFIHFLSTLMSIKASLFRSLKIYCLWSQVSLFLCFLTYLTFTKNSVYKCVLQTISSFFLSSKKQYVCLLLCMFTFVHFGGDETRLGTCGTFKVFNLTDLYVLCS